MSQATSRERWPFLIGLAIFLSEVVVSYLPWFLLTPQSHVPSVVQGLFTAVFWLNFPVLYCVCAVTVLFSKKNFAITIAYMVTPIVAGAIYGLIGWGVAWFFRSPEKTTAKTDRVIY